MNVHARLTHLHAHVVHVRSASRPACGSIVRGGGERWEGLGVGGGDAGGGSGGGLVLGCDW